MKKIISALLVVLTMISSVPLVQAASVSDFSDVGSGDWYYSAVKTVTDKGLFNGTSANTFSPLSTMERGMFVTVLGRYGNVTASVPQDGGGVVTKSDVNFRDLPTLEGSKVLAKLPMNAQVTIIEKVPGTDDATYSWYYVDYQGTKGYIREDLMTPQESAFSDVPSDGYYSAYVYWAYNTGIAGKTGETTFSPTRAITREEICSMMYNYALKRNLEVAATVSAKTFTDSGMISSSYSTAVSAMQRAGIINGFPDGSFGPQKSATRAEVSAMLTRFIDCISYKSVVESSLDSAGNYIWGTEVPASAQVNVNYFADACFIGHSIVNGMSTHFRFTSADFYAVNGANTKSILTHESFAIPDSAEKGTLSQALEAKSYGKVYIMLGTNEAGATASSRQNFTANLKAVIDLVRRTQPNAKIYLFSLTPVSIACSETRADLSRDNIIKYNSIIKQLCKDYKAYYLNVFDLLVNSDGFLPVEVCSSDGIHPYSSEYAKMRSYVLSHT